jgi:hypothetical protein
VASPAAILEQLAARPKFRRVRPNEFTASCPGPHHKRGDQRPSLSITIGDDGRVLLYCHSGGCTAEEVSAVYGLTAAALFPSSNGSAGPARPAKPSRPRAPMRRWVTYDVDDRAWTHYRDDSKDPPRWWDKGVRLDQLRPYGSEDPGEDPVYLVEGEPAADALRELGFCALATLGTSYKPVAAAMACLDGRRVILWPDADADPRKGRAHMLDMAGRLRGIAATLEWIEPPPDVFDGWDAADADEATVRRLIATAGPVPAHRQGLRFYTPRELATMTAARPEWIVGPGLAALGAITEVDGKIKAAGKTTLVLHLVSAVLDGTPFLGRAVRSRRRAAHPVP